MQVLVVFLLNSLPVIGLTQSLLLVPHQNTMTGPLIVLMLDSYSVKKKTVFSKLITTNKFIVHTVLFCVPVFDHKCS